MGATWPSCLTLASAKTRSWRRWPRVRRTRRLRKGRRLANVDTTVPRPARRLVLPERFRAVGETYGALIALLALIAYNIVFTPNFLNPFTINVNLTQVATIVIVATGMTLVIATGGIDLSVGALMAIAGALAPLIFKSPILQDTPALAITLAYLLPVLATALFGLFNGTLVAYFNIQPIIATLVLFIAGRGIAQVMTNG